MITRIKTNEGERWAIVFEESMLIDEIGAMAHGLTELMIAASASEFFENSADGFRESLYLLQLMLPTT